MTQGWGGTNWGAGSWGAGFATQTTPATFKLIGATALRENVLRVTFDLPPVYTNLMTPGDAANPKRFTVEPVQGTIGLDGEAARTVTVVQVESVNTPGSTGTTLDIYLDRPMSPYPAQYKITANQLVTMTGATLDPNGSSFTTHGVYRSLRVASTTNPAPSRDVSSPQTYSAFVNSQSGGT